MLDTFVQLLNHRVVSVIAAATLLGGAIACSDSTGPNNDTYSLVTVEGERLPYVIPNDDNDATIVNGSLNLRKNNDFSISAAAKLYPSEDVEADIRLTASGTYTISGDTIVLSVTSSSTDEIPESEVIALRSGRDIMVDFLGLDFVFRR